MGHSSDADRTCAVSEVLKRVAAENATVQSMLPRYGPVVNFTTFQQEYMRSPEAEVIGALVRSYFMRCSVAWQSVAEQSAVITVTPKPPKFGSTIIYFPGLKGT